MTELEKAARQALDALESVYGKGKRCEAAIAALRRALEQPAQQQETVAKYSDIISDGGLDPRNKFDTRPQAREPLTDEEIWKIKSDFEKYAEIKIPEKPFRHVVITIEAAHGIGD